MNINIIILIRVYSCSPMVSLILFPLSSFLFPISGLKVLLFENRKINELKSSIESHAFDPFPSPQSMGLKKQKNRHESKRGDLFDTTGKVSIQICPAEVL